MGRARKVDVEQVREAVARLRAGRQAVGIVSVMALVGGSHRVVKELLADVLAEERAAVPAVDASPEGGQEVLAPSPVPEPLMPLLRGLAAAWEDVVQAERRRAEEIVAAVERQAWGRVEAAEGELRAERLLREQTEAELLRVQEEAERLAAKLRRAERSQGEAPARPAAPTPAPAPAPTTAARRERPAAEEAAPARRAPKRDFTAEERAEVERLRAEGRGLAEIGRALGRDRSVIANLLKRLDASGTQAH